MKGIPGGNNWQFEMQYSCKMPNSKIKQQKACNKPVLTHQKLHEIIIRNIQFRHIDLCDKNLENQATRMGQTIYKKRSA